MSARGASFFAERRPVPPFSKETRFKYKAAVFHLVYGAAHRPVPTIHEWVAAQRLAYPEQDYS